MKLCSFYFVWAKVTTVIAVRESVCNGKVRRNEQKKVVIVLYSNLFCINFAHTKKKKESDWVQASRVGAIKKKQ